ncbi:MAG TPA: methionyl-tRNA formyltransferase [Gemmataceae bacterium]|jgi:methionyl-tRNA formyltransferase|nr:methionyl-tRNA formyltransferase [Gemmataceae bacterium]
MRIVMMGTGTFAEPTLEALLAGPDSVVGVFTQPDREGVQKRGSTRQVGRGMKEIAAEYGIPVFQAASVNAPEWVVVLRELSPDLLVVAAYGQILSKEVLSIPTVGGINVHGSLLPKYRGAAPVAHAILNGETETGVTIIRMSAGLDAGDMLAKASLPINDETAGEVEARLAPLGARLAVETIQRLKAGPVVGKKQDPALVTKAPKLTKEMGLIDWTKPAEVVCRQVRAMQPWPTAYTFLHRAGKPPLRVIVNRTGMKLAIPSGPAYVPGQFYGMSTAPIAVNTGSNTAVEIIELQPAGRKRMTAEEFSRGYPLTDGDRFGPEEV